MKHFDDIEVENIPVEFNGKVVGSGRMRSNGRLEILFSNPEFDGDVKQIMTLGLVAGIKIDFDYIPAVKKS